MILILSTTPMQFLLSNLYSSLNLCGYLLKCFNLASIYLLCSSDRLLGTICLTFLKAVSTLQFLIIIILMSGQLPLNNQQNIHMPKKVSIQFYNSIMVATKIFIRNLVYSLFKFIALQIFVNIFYSYNAHDNFWVALIIAQVAAAVLIIYNALMIHRFKSVAQQTGHIFQQQQSPSNPYRYVNNNIEAIRSNKYSFNEAVEGVVLSEQDKRKSQQIIANSLPKLYSNNCLIQNIRNIGMSTSVGLVIFFIYALAMYSYGSAMQGFIITYIIIEFFAKIQFFLGLILLALCPLITLIICFCMCFCKKQGQQDRVMPQFEKIPFVVGTVLEQPDCGICFQTFSAGDTVTKLPCNSKHLFHDFCISQWHKVSATCPLCRKNLSVQ